MATNNTKKINKHVFVWVFSFLLGCVGADRFVRGQIGLGIVKLLFGWITCGLWALIDWIIAVSKAYGSSYGSVEDLTFDAAGKYLK